MARQMKAKSGDVVVALGRSFLVLECYYDHDDCIGRYNGRNLDADCLASDHYRSFDDLDISLVVDKDDPSLFVGMGGSSLSVW